jgi:hypothetical protein
MIYSVFEPLRGFIDVEHGLQTLFRDHVAEGSKIFFCGLQPTYLTDPSLALRCRNPLALATTYHEGMCAFFVTSGILIYDYQIKPSQYVYLASKQGT